ncbi:hypothetical protein GCM10023322_49150 [Rugosimonospora acidiphila]|uniref:Uncharacterized protein n=1 Tax=Rugosimonospora acidiphila TaxID=556531 RepID=A0ABP9S7X5_9ACTN
MAAGPVACGPVGRVDRWHPTLPGAGRLGPALAYAGRPADARPAGRVPASVRATATAALAVGPTREARDGLGTHAGPVGRGAFHRRWARPDHAAAGAEFGLPIPAG